MKLWHGGIPALFMLVLASCGQNYCVFGLVGNCEEMFKNGQTQSGVGGPIVVSQAQNQNWVYLTAGQSLQLTVTGGTPPITAVAYDLPGCGTLDTSFKFTPLIAGPCKITFRDKTSTPQQAIYTVDVRNPTN